MYILGSFADQELAAALAAARALVGAPIIISTAYLQHIIFP